MYLPLLYLLFLASCLTHQALGRGRGRPSPEGSLDPSSRITVVGVVYCDTCSINTFSRQSYFLQGVEVHVTCRFKASSPKTAEEVNISVNRTTNRSGVYKLEIPHVDGIDCVDGIAISSQCSAKILKTSSDDNGGCSIPVFQTATNEVSIKSKQDRVCIYSLSALSYKPPHKNTSLCGNGGKKHHRKDEKVEKKFRDSKFFWPYLAPYWFPWPYPDLPPLPTLPPFPSFPFPSLPFGNPNLALPAFDWKNPVTWIPYLPRFPPGDHNP
ncbi:putative protein [Arabidopsis thaliana]|uniref:Pollen Ole e 1 allergen and extensin family protein n=1 Tax=Arabidopsis thaliana TaxID=3702 RepID=Q9FY96_ARATH|nr:Pollen Ole e 1 allergen and extensin family protein [Arabidopsis thaliana]AAO42056.1 unknown protein [Arabidopsis thaliana]AAO50718.1 unknown protein [Arabidopsis thaliana]AED91856.1 Pollen Ole e 1 allergen and extensin family protein [Arabidopsis thaliana]CAC05442.1 putative protein [Arabidopsis thaliana]|eukprot:NP_196818.1 Pollen Ole e 1 allergen and extensin family protein [Arabidopsis thaliana]